jgi:phosphohistidine phosphatase
MELFFVRHGAAVGTSVWSGDDASRPLTKSGRKRFLAATRAVARCAAPPPDRIVSSPLVRAVQTAEILAEAFGGVTVIEDEKLDPEFNLEALTAVLAEQADASVLAIVGHNPSFSEVLSTVTGARDLEMAKGAIALVRIDDRDKPKGQLVWLAPTSLFADGR